MYVVNLLMVFIPFFFYVLISLKKRNDYTIQPISPYTNMALLCIMAVLMALTPTEEGNDKYYYMLEYLGDVPDRDNEIGWVWYNAILRKIFGGNFILFFLFTSAFYSYSYYRIAKKYFSKELMGYFIVMAVGSLGFTAYGGNALRAGVAISLFFYAISVTNKLRNQLPLVLLSLLIHKSMIIPIFALIVSYFVRNRRLIESFWFFCLMFSLLNIDLGFIFEKVGFIDQRVEDYSSDIGDGGDYGSKFRFDFLLYSFVPIYISNLWIKKYNYGERFYMLIYKSYVLSNAVWLLVIRIPFSDRVAYLSWFLIPLLVLYPLLTGNIRMKKPQKVVIVSMGLFICLNVILNLR